MEEIPAPPSHLPIPETEEVALAEFARDPGEHLHRARKSGKAVVLMDDEGYADAVLLDIDVYERLLEALDQADTQAMMYRGLLEDERGQGRPAADVFRDLRAMGARRRSA